MFDHSLSRKFPLNKRYSIDSNGNIWDHAHDRELFPYVREEEYKIVTLHKPQTITRVSRMVAITFLENPQHYPIVDHINHDVGDNRVENLRWCTRSMNGGNMSRQKRRAYCILPKNVTLVNRKYQVVMWKQGVQYYFGRFLTVTEAYDAACAGRKQLWGDFAYDE